jgi:hypothetical protein
MRKSEVQSDQLILYGGAWVAQYEVRSTVRSKGVNQSGRRINRDQSPLPGGVTEGGRQGRPRMGHERGSALSRSTPNSKPRKSVSECFNANCLYCM